MPIKPRGQSGASASLYARCYCAERVITQCRRWIHHGSDHERMGSSRAAPGSQGSVQASGPASSISSEMLSAHDSDALAAHPVNGVELSQLSTELCPGQGAAVLDSTPADAGGVGPAQASMQRGMQADPGLQLAPAATPLNQHIQRQDSKAVGAIQSVSGTNSTSRGLDEGQVVEICSLFRDASVLVGMHPDQVRCHHVLTLCPHVMVHAIRPANPAST